MSWRIAISHRTGYRYAEPMRASYNEARLTPPSVDGQRLLQAALAVTPAVRPFRYVDYWGTTVDSFDVHVPHTERAGPGAAEARAALILLQLSMSLRASRRHRGQRAPSAYRGPERLPASSTGVASTAVPPSDRVMSSHLWCIWQGRQLLRRVLTPLGRSQERRRIAVIGRAYTQPASLNFSST